MFHVSYYFDFLSPYSFLSWKWFYREYETQLKGLADFSLYPVNLANIIHAHDTKGPAEIAPKREFLMKDCLRYCLEHNLEFNPPVLPFNALYALRLSLQECSGEDQKEVINLFYCAAWEKGLDLGDDAVIFELLDQAGYPAAQWLELVGDRVIRSQLKMNTKMAIDAGVFGLPTFIVREIGDKKEDKDGELFWGNDSTQKLVDYLQGKDPFAPHSQHLESNKYKDKLRFFQGRYQSP
jgi:2-hydroxychromene-2-carboxylate isomerase